MARRRYFRTTQGLRQEVLIAKDADYTTDATFAAFVANKAAGEDGKIGIFLANAKTLVSANTPLVNGTEYIIAQKRDNDVKVLSKIKWDSSAVSKTPYVAPVKEVWTVTFSGTLGTEFKVNDLVSIGAIETTFAGYIKETQFTYEYFVKAGDTTSSIASGIADKINKYDSILHSNQDYFLSASATNNVLTITALYEGSSFKIGTPGSTYLMATAVQTTRMKIGSGYYQQLKDLEYEGAIEDGVRTQYPGDGFSPDDFGKATSYASASEQYTMYNIANVRTGKTPIPVGVQHYNWNAVIAIPQGSDSNVDTAVDTMFGFTAPV